MAMVTLASPNYNPNLQRTLSLDAKNANLRSDASFSSYLNKGEETFVRKLAEPNRNMREEQLRSMTEKKEEDEEIGVFGAERYFNGGIDDTSPRITNIDPKIYQSMKDGKVSPGPVRPKMQLAGTPSIRSESSWNSQSALLKNSVLRNPPPRRKTNKGNVKSFLAILGCKYCYCSDKDSVDIEDEHVGELSFSRNANSVVVPGQAASRESASIKTGGLDLAADEVHVNGTVPADHPGLSRDNCFSFPAMNSEVAIQRSLPIKTKFQEMEEIPRKSIEVFGSPALQKRNKGLSLEMRKLTMLSWNGTPRMDQEHDFSTIYGANHNDAESDASSDLFEIDSLTGKPNPFLARQASDATSGCVTPTTGYAPSEASIEWSVVTASAADFSSVTDCEEIRSSRGITSPVRNFAANKDSKAKANREIHKHIPSSLLGCNSQKAVRVAGDAHRKNQKPNYEAPQVTRRASDSYAAVTRFPAESKLPSFDPRNGVTTFSIQRSQSQSPRASHLLYI